MERYQGTICALSRKQLNEIRDQYRAGKISLIRASQRVCDLGYNALRAWEIVESW